MELKNINNTLTNSNNGCYMNDSTSNQNIKEVILENYDISGDKLITLKECAEILGLKYHTARKILYQDTTIGYVDYGSKKLWVLNEILNFKNKHYSKTLVA